MKWRGPAENVPGSVLLHAQVRCCPRHPADQGRAQAYLPNHPGQGGRAGIVSRFFKKTTLTSAITGAEEKG